MGGRASSRPTMSLLAFQDIITSVSGILMFIVLMLSLELSNESASSSSSTVDPADVARVEAAVAAARNDKIRLERDLAENDDVARAAASIAPEQLRSDVRNLDERIAALADTIARLESRRDLALADQRAAEAGDSAAAGAEREATRQALQMAAQLAKELSEVQSDDRPVFSLPRGLNRPGWLVVISADRCEVAPLGLRAAPRSYPVKSSSFLARKPDVSAFLDWVHSQERHAYFLLIARPTGANAFGVIREDVETTGVAFGFDLASARRKLLDPERGAHQ